MPEKISSALMPRQKKTAGDKYLKMGKAYFESLVKYCWNETAYAHLKSVKTKEQTDSMQSFFLAETLKYCYLIFAREGTIDFRKVLFNTEAHPLNVWSE